MDESLDRLESLFAAALQKPEADRAAYLDQECADDPALRERAEALLRAQAAAGSFLGSPAPCPVMTVDEQPVGEGPGTVIGPYKLLEQIGEGGFGVVFMAEQTQPVRRKVALKVLKPGMDTRQVVARFEAEFAFSNPRSESRTARETRGRDAIWSPRQRGSVIHAGMPLWPPCTSRTPYIS